MQLNEGKYHLVIFGTSKKKVNMRVREVQIEESDEEKLLGATFDKKLSLKKHVLTLCKNGSQKFHALRRISIYMQLEKLKLLMKTFAKQMWPSSNALDSNQRGPGFKAHCKPLVTSGRASGLKCSCQN